MSMTVIVTRDVESRFRGFLASVAQEVAPGVYLSPRMSAGVRERAWDVLADWFVSLGRGGDSGGSIVMAFRDAKSANGFTVRTLGLPPRELSDVDGLLLVRRST